MSHCRDKKPPEASCELAEGRIIESDLDLLFECYEAKMNLFEEGVRILHEDTPMLAG